MIVVDTNVLVALVDPRDSLHRRVTSDLKRLLRHPLVVSMPILTEACFALPRRHERARLRALLDAFSIRLADGEAFGASYVEVFTWLDRYAEHAPDWTDATLAVAAGRDEGLRVWTYDREFRTIWRRPDGSRIPLAVR